MKAVIATGALLAAGVLTWQIGARLSTDAVGMAVGLIFGVLGGIPAALLVLSGAGPRSDRYSEGYNAGKRDAADIILNRRPELPQPPAQPPVIIVQPTFTVARPFAPPSFPNQIGVGSDWLDEV